MWRFKGRKEITNSILLNKLSKLFIQRQTGLAVAVPLPFWISTMIVVIAVIAAVIINIIIIFSLICVQTKVYVHDGCSYHIRYINVTQFICSKIQKCTSLCSLTILLPFSQDLTFPCHMKSKGKWIQWRCPLLLWKP